MRYFILVLYALCQVLTFAIFIRAVLSWFPTSNRSGFLATIQQVMYQITEPMLAPLRRIVPRTGMIDFTAMIAMILLQILAAVLVSV